MKKKIPRTQASKKDKNLLINTSDSEKEEKPKKSKKQKKK